MWDLESSRRRSRHKSNALLLVQRRGKRSPRRRGSPRRSRTGIVVFASSSLCLRSANSAARICSASLVPFPSPPRADERPSCGAPNLDASLLALGHPGLTHAVAAPPRPRPHGAPPLTPPTPPPRSCRTPSTHRRLPSSPRASPTRRRARRRGGRDATPSRHSGAADTAAHAPPV
ncbi:hypothetical protein C8R45DRAFT_596835 [Mycena sanguinolenta]|nr:hypothetical protein C8R45DRAFT_596835 [Mycena sanguinolenta]